MQTPRVLYGATAAGYLITLGFIFREGSPATPGWWGAAIVFFVWTSTPFIAMAFAGKKLAGRPAPRLLLTLGAIGLAASAFWFLRIAFVRSPDAQSGVVFVILPLYQLAGVLLLAALAGLVARLSVYLPVRMGGPE